MPLGQIVLSAVLEGWIMTILGKWIVHFSVVLWTIVRKIKAPEKEYTFLLTHHETDLAAFAIGAISLILFVIFPNQKMMVVAPACMFVLLLCVWLSSLIAYSAGRSRGIVKSSWKEISSRHGFS